MQIELGALIGGCAAMLTAFATAIIYAAAARSDARRANERCTDIGTQVNIKNEDLKDQINLLFKKHESLESKIYERLSEIEKLLYRIQGGLDNKNHPLA